MLEARWATPARFLADADAGAPITTYPTQAQLLRLAGFAEVADALAAGGDALPPATITTVEVVDGRPAMVVAGPDGVPRRFHEGPVRDNELPPGRRV